MGRQLLDEIKKGQLNTTIPKLTDEILKETFSTTRGQQVISEIKAGKLVPMRMIMDGILKFKAADIYFDGCWGDEGGLIIKDIVSMFSWRDGDRSLKNNECLQFYNDFLVPLWNFFNEENPRPLVFDCEDKIIVKKSELSTLMWLVVKCQSLGTLNLGIYPTPKKTHKKKSNV